MGKISVKNKVHFHKSGLSFRNYFQRAESTSFFCTDTSTRVQTSWDNAPVQVLQERDTSCLARVWKVQINVSTTAKDLVKMEEGSNSSKRIYIHGNISLTWFQHILNEKEVTAQKTAQQWRTVDMMTIVIEGGKNWRLRNWKISIPGEAQGWQHHVVELLYGRKNWCTLQNQWPHDEGKLCGYIEAGSQDISQGVKSLVTNGSTQWTLSTSIFAKLWQNGLKNKVKASECPSQKTNLNPVKIFVGRAEKVHADQGEDNPIPSSNRYFSLIIIFFVKRHSGLLLK